MLSCEDCKDLAGPWRSIKYEAANDDDLPHVCLFVCLLQNSELVAVSTAVAHQQPGLDYCTNRFNMADQVNKRCSSASVPPSLAALVATLFVPLTRTHWHTH